MCNCVKPCRVCKCKPRANKFGKGILFFPKKKEHLIHRIRQRGMTASERMADAVFGGGPRTLGETILALFMFFSIGAIIFFAYWAKGHWGG